MSMEVLTILQVIWSLASYLVMTLALPALLLYRKIKHLRFCERFIAYQMAGNFYMMNLVSVLELLHISNRVTLTLLTILPCAGIYVILYKKKPMQMLQDVFEFLERLAGGQVGTRLFLRRVRVGIWHLFKRGVCALFRRIRSNFIDILLISLLTAGLCYVYGTNLLQHFGYCESDLPVHNYWVNYLGKNKMFVAGIYPFGFHCVIYYLHEVFAIPTYVLLRVFCFVQNLMIHYVLLAFIKYCCKSKFAPYVGVYAYVFLKVFGENTYIRYFSTLPQEFGMIFILPSIYYLFAFFVSKKQKPKNRKGERAPLTIDNIAQTQEERAVFGEENSGWIDEELPPLSEESIIRIEEHGIVKTQVRNDVDGSAEQNLQEGDAEGEAENRTRLQRWKEARTARKEARVQKRRIARRVGQGRWAKITGSEGFWYLAGFAISFGMTLSAHFYDTMIAGLLCIGVACGYFFRLFRPKYFGKVMLAGILSIFVAILPMLVAFAMGTPLQGSLGWGMKVISGDNNKEVVQAAPVKEQGSANIGTGTAGNGMDAVGDGQQAGQSQDGLETMGDGSFVIHQKSLPEKVLSKLETAVGAFWEAMKIYIILDSYPLFQILLVGSIVFLALLSLVFFLVRQTDYGARCLSLSAGLVALSVLQASSRLGLPTLMDAIRTCIFYAYVLVAAWSLCVDGVLQLLFGWFKKKWILHTVSLAVLAAVVVYSDQEGLIRTPPVRESLQTNEAILCLTNILHDNEDFTWTICSANDELRMGEDYGYHHEVHTFLRDLERKGRTHSVTIPTSKVYFFIEKIPIMYGRAYRGDEPEISEEFANEPLPTGAGITMYQGVNRLIEMSKLYEWAQDFAELYPNDVKVYYESDNFVCYCVEQDLYRPFNFAIERKD